MGDAVEVQLHPCLTPSPEEMTPSTEMSQLSFKCACEAEDARQEVDAPCTLGASTLGRVPLTAIHEEMIQMKTMSESLPERLFEVPSAPGKTEDAGRETDDLLEEIARMSEASTRGQSSIASSTVGESEFAGTADGEYLIQIERTKKRKSMGLELGVVKNVGRGDWTSGGLKVKNVHRGLVGQWNRSHSMKVCTGDIIVEVNSVRGSGEALLEKIANEMVLELRLLRPGELDQEPNDGWSPPLTPRSY